MHRAGAAKGHAATKLCSRQSKNVPHVPEQGHIRIAVKAAIDSIYLEFHHVVPIPYQTSILRATLYRWNSTQNPAHQQFACVVEKALSPSVSVFRRGCSMAVTGPGAKEHFVAGTRPIYGKKRASFNEEPPLHRTRRPQARLVSPSRRPPKERPWN